MSTEIELVDKDLIEVDEEAKDNVNRFALTKETPFPEQMLMKFFERTPERFIKERPGKGGGNFRYVTGNYIKKKLNYTFGWLWDSEVVRSENIVIEGKIIEIVVDVKCTFKIWDKKTNAYIAITKTQSGGAEVKYQKKNPIMPVDFANDRKAAITDGVKKCAAELGIASDVYASDEFNDLPDEVKQEVEERAEKKTRTKKVIVETKATPEEPKEEVKTETPVKTENNLDFNEEKPKVETDAERAQRTIQEAKELLTEEEKNQVKDLLNNADEQTKKDLMEIFSNGLFETAERVTALRKILVAKYPKKEEVTQEVVDKKVEAIVTEPVKEEKTVLEMVQDDNNPLDLFNDAEDGQLAVQNKKMHALWREYLLIKDMTAEANDAEKSKELRINAMNQFFKRDDIKSSNDLNRTEMDSFIEALQERIDRAKGQSPS
jgi:hypothetical protein